MKKLQFYFLKYVPCPLTSSWSFAQTVADWHVYHTPASRVATLPGHKLSHPQNRLTSAHTAMTTLVTTMLTDGTMATAVTGTHLWCQKGGLIYFANVFTSGAGLLLLSLTDIVFYKINWQNHTWCMAYHLWYWFGPWRDTWNEMDTRW